MKRLRYLHLVLCCAAAGACQAPVPPPADPMLELLAADRALAQGVQQAGASRMRGGYLPDGVMLRDGYLPLDTDSARHAYHQSIGDTMVHLSWVPLHAEVAPSADLGYTYGVYTRVVRRQHRFDTLQVTYALVWHRDSTGRWRIAADITQQGLGLE